MHTGSYECDDMQTEEKKLYLVSVERFPYGDVSFKKNKKKTKQNITKRNFYYKKPLHILFSLFFSLSYIFETDWPVADY